MSFITIDTRLIGGTFREWTPKFRLDFGEKARKLSDEDFFELCRDNPDARIEMDANGDIEFMPPTGSETGIKNFKLTTKFGNWVSKDGSGEGFDSSTGFTLPKGAKRTPDLSWISSKKWNATPQAKRKTFAPVCHDFGVELRSETDSLTNLQTKMEEHIANGVSLGWLITPQEKQIFIYRMGKPVEIVENPSVISGEPLLQNFILNLKEIWN